jgi:hypothetical protein
MLMVVSLINGLIGLHIPCLDIALASNVLKMQVLMTLYGCSSGAAYCQVSLRISVICSRNILVSGATVAATAESSAVQSTTAHSEVGTTNCESS